MSRSNNTEIISPSKRFFEWQGSTGKLKYFDKSIGEKGEIVILDLPFTFLVLDRLHTITGFSDADQSGFWANEIRDIKTEILTVRTKKGIEQKALYSELAPTLNKGASYAQSVYIAYFEGKDLMIGNIKIHGSAIGAWIDFCKGKDLYKIAINISGATPEKKGATNYFTPVFEAKQVSEATNEKATALDVELQQYLDLYLKKQSVDVPVKSNEDLKEAEHHNAVSEFEKESQQSYTNNNTHQHEPPVGNGADDDLPF